MNASLRQFVWERADGCCEYCRLHQEFDLLPHHIDHVIARKHRGADTEDNLALKCVNCSLAKGPNIAGRDPRTNRLTRLFHPRTDNWLTHFRWNGAVIIGRTVIGRATVIVLNMNEPDRIALRAQLIADCKFPN